MPKRPNLSSRLGARWERRMAALERAEGARRREEAREAWARQRARLATERVEVVRHTVVLALPTAADVVWQALVDPTGPLACVDGEPLAAAAVPGPPPDVVGGRTCSVTLDSHGHCQTMLDEVVHVEPGRRITRQPLHLTRRWVNGWWVEPDGNGSVLRGFIEMDADPPRAWQYSANGNATLQRSMWQIARAVAGPAYAPDPQPPRSAGQLAEAREHDAVVARQARGPRVPVEATASVTLECPMHAAWVATCAATSPVAEHGDPDAWWFPLTPPTGSGTGLRAALSRHPVGGVRLLPYEVVASEPGARICTREIDHNATDAEVVLTPAANGVRVDVRMRRDVPPAEAEATRRVLTARACMNALRIERHAVNGPRPPLDDVWFP